MSDTSKLSTCQIVCWGLSGITGLMVLWSASGSVGFFAALLLGAAFGVFLALVFTQLICTGYGGGDAGIKARDVKDTMRHVTGITGYKAPFDENDEARPAPRAAAPAAEASADASVKTGTTLAGEEELAARKGEWSYGNGAAVAEDAVGRQPEALDAPKGGQADDLKQIKGVGPKLEKLCHSMGFYHFHQIAGWTAAEVAWVDANLEGFKGRVSRDDWVAQAKTLAAGGETEFSIRVGDGDVY